MSASDLDILEQCQNLLGEYRAALSEGLRRGNQQDDPQSIMLQRAFDFGDRTITAISILLKVSEDNALFACTLLRPFYEVALRLLWASRSKNGWQRLQVHWAKEDEKWAKEAEKMPSVADHARAIGEARAEVLERTGANGKPYQPAPGIQQTLKEIEEHDIAEGLRKKDSDAAAFDYTNFYRTLCQPAHGHIVAIGPLDPGAFIRHACSGVLMATGVLLQACCHVAGADPKREVEVVAQRIMKLLMR